MTLTITTTLPLAGGSAIPQLGLGVWRLSEADAADVLAEAFDVGLRHIDTAQGYENEAAVGRAIAASGLLRDEVFVTSKLRTRDFPNAGSSLDGSLRKLGLGHLDLFLLHWPVPARGTALNAWRALIAAQAAGKVRSIGVSNFLPAHIDSLVAETGVMPAVNQVELHPYYQQRDIRDYHRQNGIVLESYSPLGGGVVLADPVIGEIARRLGRTPAQVIIRWHLQQGLVALPKTATVSRVAPNAQVFDFALSEADMAAINALDRPDGKVLPHPERMNNLF